MNLKSKTAIITGGASGIGRAVAERLHVRGVNVGILDVNVDRGNDTARSLGANALFYAVDITNEEGVRSAIAATTAAFGDIHICCNFAGVAAMKRTIGRGGAMPLDQFTRTIDVNLVGTFNVVRLCAERMARNSVIDEYDNRGVIINVASIAAFQGPSGSVAYTASKAAIVGMTLPLARDLAPFGIRVNTIAPGLVSTPMTLGAADTPPELAEQRLQQSLENVLYPRRFGTTDEIAHLTQCIIENDYINAECIRIDGGKRV